MRQNRPLRLTEPEASSTGAPDVRASHKSQQQRSKEVPSARPVSRDGAGRRAGAPAGMPLFLQGKRAGLDAWGDAPEVPLFMRAEETGAPGEGGAARAGGAAGAPPRLPFASEMESAFGEDFSDVVVR